MADNNGNQRKRKIPDYQASSKMQRPGRGPGMHGPSLEKPKNTKKTIGRLFAYLGSSKYLLIFILLLIGCSTLAQLVGTWYLKPLINDYIIPGNFDGIGRALLILLSIYVVGVIANFLQGQLMLRVAQRTVHTMRRDMFDHMETLPLRYFDSHSHGELMSRYTNDMDNVQIAMEQSLIQIAANGVMFIGTIIMMLILSPMLFLVSGSVIAIMLILSKTIGSRSREHFRVQQASLGRMNGFIEENIEGIKVVKAFTREKASREDFNELGSVYRAAATKANIFAGIVMPIMGNLNQISFGLTAAFGGFLAINYGLDIGSLAAFLQYSRQMGMPINQIASQVNLLMSALAGAERIFNMMDEEPETDNGQWILNRTGERDGWAWERKKKTEDIERVPLRGDVRLHDVTFSYDEREIVLRNVNLYAKPGQTIAFVGSTGAGKTTISNLLNRFYDVQEGAVTYDGIDVKEIRKADLRGALGMVLQDTHLFTGSIMDNIRYGRLEASDEECRTAARQASADSFIRRMPNGYQTRITGDGSNLSQGQRQLLAIARAYVADPPVMILDEATSSIDTRTERLIERGMHVLMEGRTVFVIAHRLSTVRNANAIIVLEKGSIIERGDHDDLVTQGGHYYKLYTGQYQLT